MSSWFGMGKQTPPPAAPPPPPPLSHKSSTLIANINEAIKNKSIIINNISNNNNISENKAGILIKVLSPYMVFNRWTDDNPDGEDYVEPPLKLMDLHSRDIIDGYLTTLNDMDKENFLKVQTSMNTIVSCALTNPDNTPPPGLEPSNDEEYEASFGIMEALETQMHAGADPNLTNLQATCWIALLQSKQYSYENRLNVYTAVYWCLGAHEAYANAARADAEARANEARADAGRANADRANAAGANADGPETPYAFKCPITHSIMHDPVIIGGEDSDGHTYERTAIREWLDKSNRSPVTNMTLSDKNLIPNRALKEAIENWKQNNGQNAGKRKRKRRTIKKRKGVARRTKRARTASRRRVLNKH